MCAKAMDALQTDDVVLDRLASALTDGNQVGLLVYGRKTKLSFTACMGTPTLTSMAAWRI